MTMDGTALKSLFVETLRDPRAAARGLLAADIPRTAAWMALALVAVISAMLAWFGGVLLGQPEGPFGSLGPGMLAVLVYSNMVILVFALFWTGRMLGATEDLGRYVVVMAWGQAVASALQVAQLLAILALPGLAGLLTIAMTLYLLWIMLVFLGEAAGHTGIGRTILHLMLAMVGMVIGLTLILSVVGIAA